jgi:disulfide bond formation protein DsbB
VSKLGGWWRLWVVLSVLLVIFAIYVTINEKDYWESSNGPSQSMAFSCIPFTKLTSETIESEIAGDSYDREAEGEYVVIDGKITQLAADDPRNRNFTHQSGPKPTAKFETRCSSWSALTVNIFTVSLFAALVAALGLAFRWIFRGFRKNVI